MKILGISNIPFRPLNELAGTDKSSSGSWLEAAFQSLKNVIGLKLIIVTISRGKRSKIEKRKDQSFFILLGGFPLEYSNKTLRIKKL
ncbi:MAG: hypothetical protein Q7J19_07725 [Lutibacter sp.]|nr:hypothetical protein [Lutibacter sp.]